MPVTEIRQTAIDAVYIDDHLNEWEDLAGEDINIEVAYRYPVGSGPDETDPEYWGYRGQAAMCELPNGHFIRVRIGDGSASDRNVYIQDISDFGNPLAWTTWTLKYLGNHYAIAIEPDPTSSSGYNIYTSKVTGIFVNNILKYGDPFNAVVKIKPVEFSQFPGFIYVQLLTTDDGDGGRMYQWYFFRDITSTAPLPVADIANYRWYREDVMCMRQSQGLFYRFRSMAMEGGSRHQAASEVLTCEEVASDQSDLANFNKWGEIRYLKGPSGQAGFKTITNLRMFNLPVRNEFAYFLFYNEQHRDVSGNVLSNLRMPLFWSLSFGFPFYLTQPIPLGFSVWGFAGVVTTASNIYVAGNGRVLRRPVVPDFYHLEDYVVHGQYNKPRGNEKATGYLDLANPNNDVGQILGLYSDNPAGLTGNRLYLALGKQLPQADGPTMKVDSDWYGVSAQKTKEGKKYRVRLNFGDFWAKLENPFRDTITQPGHFNWDDWGAGGVNQLYNWFNDTDEMFRYSPSVPDALSYTVPRLRTTRSGEGPGGNTYSLFSGWRGENGRVQAIIWETGAGVVFRYQDASNYMYWRITDNQSIIAQVVGGFQTILDTKNQHFDAALSVELDFRWGHIVAKNNSTVVHDIVLTNPPILTGFVGFFGGTSISTLEVSNVNITDFNVLMTTRELCRILLAYADVHGVEIEEESTDAQQISLIWGPQSDLDNPSKAFEQLLEASKIQAKWIPDEQEL